MFARSRFARAAFLAVLSVPAVVFTGSVFGAEPEAATGGPKPVGQEGIKVIVQDAPRELAMRSLPTYRIQPPDIIAIDMPKMVPLPPYRAAAYDVLEVHVANALKDQPIDNYFMVEAEGIVSLGPAYGTVRVLGMTLDEAKKAIAQKLSQVVRKPEVSVKLARVSGCQPLSAQYLVAQDGTINLHQYGLVHVAGMTVAEAQLALQKHLAKFLTSPELSVDVAAYNSKVYYVVTEGAGAGDGDSVNRFAVTGNETVLDAISQLNGLSQLSKKKIWLVRPSASDAKQGTVLPVDWVGITRRGATGTNYQIFPGDRIFIAGEERPEPPAVREK